MQTVQALFELEAGVLHLALIPNNRGITPIAMDQDQPNEARAALEVALAKAGRKGEPDDDLVGDWDQDCSRLGHSHARTGLTCLCCSVAD
jgi:hypothetical protein